MPVKMDITFDVREVERWLNSLERRAVPGALSQALNKTIAGVQTEGRRAMSDWANVQQKHIKPHLKIEKAFPAHPAARLIGRSRNIPLIHFRGVNQAKAPKGGRRPPVSVRIFGRNRVLRGAFITKIFRGPGVFVRRGRARGPVREAVGPSVGQIMRTPHINRVMVTAARKRFRKEFDRALRFQLRKIK